MQPPHGPSGSDQLQANGPAGGWSADRADAAPPVPSRESKLAALKGARCSAGDKDERIRQATEALATLPDIIRVSDEDARWVAEDPDLEDQ